MCLAMNYAKMARGRRLKVGAPFIIQPFFHSFKAGKNWCDNRCSMLIVCRSADRLLWVKMRVATMNRVSFFVLLFTECKIKIPVFPKLTDLLHIVKKLDKKLFIL